MDEIDVEEVTTIRVKRSREQGGGTIFSISFTHDGPRSCGGRLLVEQGDGQRVEIGDPLRLFDEVFTLGRLEGMKAKAAE